MDLSLCRLTEVAMLVLVFSLQIKSAKHGRILQINSCKAEVDGRLINLEPLQRQDGFPRFTIEHHWWNYTFNPCESYNDPLDPHTGHGDQCLYVAMCRSRWRSDSNIIDYYTLGIQRTVRISFRRSYFLDDLSSEETSEESSENSAIQPFDGSNSGVIDNEDSSMGGNAAEELDDSSEEELTSSNWSKPLDTTGGNNNNKNINLTLSNDTYSIHSNRTPLLSESSVRPPESNVETKLSTQAPRRHLRKSGKEQPVINRRTTLRKKEQKGSPIYEYSNENNLENKERDANTNADDVPRVVLRLRGIRSMKLRRTFIYLVCNPLMRLVDEAQFLYVGRTTRNLYFELHHKCCCPDGCQNGHLDVLPLNESVALTEMQMRLLELEESGPKHLWIVLVVNASVLVTAVMIGLVCCRKGGSAGPYNMLPGLRQTRFFSSMESMSSSTMKGHRPPEHLEYSTPMLQPTKLPLLENCVIPSRDLEIGQRLGGGLFGDTYVAEWRDRQVAVKRFTVGVHQNQLKDDDHEWLAREVSYLARQRNKHVVTLLGICLELRQPHIVNEFIDGQTLKDFLIRELHIISLARRVKMLIQVTEGMHFLHSAKYPVLHRDLRAANLLITTNDKIKICDFGITKMVQRLRKECTVRECYCQKHTSALPASIRWTAPEILQMPTAEETEADAFTPSCDVYSFAMVLWEVASGLDPYEDIQDEKEVVTIVLRGGRPNPDAIQGCIPHYRELMKVCWDSEPDARPTFKQLTMHLKTVLQVARKFESSNRARSNSAGASSYLKSALSIHIENV